MNRITYIVKSGYEGEQNLFPHFKWYKKKNIIYKVGNYFHKEWNQLPIIKYQGALT